MMSTHELIGYLAAAFTTCSFAPQAWLTFRTRDVSGISLGMYGVFACGVALFVMATGMYDSLERARNNYYDSARMADVAVSVVRAPDPVASDLAELPGVNAIEPRVSGIGLIDLAGKSDPVSARLVSLPPDRHPRVNDVLLRAGRWPYPTRDNEVLINEAFA